MTKLRLAIVTMFSLTLCSVALATDNKVASKLEQTNGSAISNNDYFRKNSVTGIVKLPDADYYQALQDLNLNQSSAGLEVEVMADGSKRVNLQGRFMMHSSVVNKDGQVKHICDSRVPTADSIKPLIKRAVQ